MPAKYGRRFDKKHDAGKLWLKDSKGQGFGSLYGGNRDSVVSKDLNEKTISESRQSSDLF
jgi:hypothetical protein